MSLGALKIFRLILQGHTITMYERLLKASMHVHTVPIAIPIGRLGWAQTHKACQLHSNAYISSLKAMHASTQFHAFLASIITRVSPCWVNLEAATCTAFTYNTYA